MIWIKGTIDLRMVTGRLHVQSGLEIHLFVEHVGSRREKAGPIWSHGHGADVEQDDDHDDDLVVEMSVIRRLAFRRVLLSRSAGDDSEGWT